MRAGPRSFRRLRGGSSCLFQLLGAPGVPGLVAPSLPTLTCTQLDFLCPTLLLLFSSPGCRPLPGILLTYPGPGNRTWICLCGRGLSLDRDFPSFTPTWTLFQEKTSNARWPSKHLQQQRCSASCRLSMAPHCTTPLALRSPPRLLALCPFHDEHGGRRFSARACGAEVQTEACVLLPGRIATGRGQDQSRSWWRPTGSLGRQAGGQPLPGGWSYLFCLNNNGYDMKRAKSYFLCPRQGLT